MEDAPITLAHIHARNAVLETRRSNPVAASEEHDLAAAEFANAAQSTSDGEAFRLLHLLEQHHKKLGQILISRHEAPQPAEKPENRVSAEGESDPGKKAAAAGAAAAPPFPASAPDPTPFETSKRGPSSEPSQQPPRLAPGTRATARDLSSSIASNLASARGIPGGQRRAMPVSPTLSEQNVPGKFIKDQPNTKATPAATRTPKLSSGFFTSNDRYNDGKPSWAPPARLTSEEPPMESAPSMNDAPFQQFYKTYESLRSKLNAPLAFAGLPLVSRSKANPNPNPASGPDKPATTAKEAAPHLLEPEADYSQLISKAALHAVQDGHPPSSNPAESFYVVPTTGGTISYADVMTRADRGGPVLRHTRHLSNVSEDTMEDFVDANETLGPATKSSDPDHTSTPPSRPPRNGKSMEELMIENAALKRDTDNLSRRLHVFENSAQSSSAALAHSIRSLTARSPHNNPRSQPSLAAQFNPTDPNPESAATRQPKIPSSSSTSRISELEELLLKNSNELARRETENARLRETVTRYRDKWENLRKSAKARRDNSGNPAPAQPPSAVTND